MKILQVISSFPPAYSYGGALNVAYHLSKKLVMIGHDVTVYTTDVYNSQSRLDYKENPEIMDGITVYRFRNISNYLSRKNFTCSPSMLFSLKNQIKQFDIIHLHEYRSFQAIFAFYYAQKYNIPYILQAHGSVLPFFEKETLKKMFDVVWGNKIIKNASKVIAVSKVEREQYLKMGIPENKIAIIPNGFDVSEYENLPERGKFRQKYNIKPEEKLILYLGRLHKSKGLDFLINGYLQIYNQNQLIKLVLAGPNDGFLDEIMSQIQKKNIMKSVLVTDPLYGIEKLEAYVDADVLVYPGILEIFGLVPFEAIMCGTPVIVCDDCGCGEIIREADCGYLVKYGDNDNLAEILQYALEHPDENKKMVKNGQRYIQDIISWNKVIMQIERLYANCLCDI